MVALHADKLPKWREQMQKELVQDIDQGLGLTAREIAHAEALRSVLWHRVRAFMATRDLLILPTVAVPPFPVDQPYPTEINGKPLESYFQWFYLTYGITLTGLPAISVPCGFTRDGLPVGLADRRPPPSGGRRPPRRRRLRGGRAVGRPPASGGHLTRDMNGAASQGAPGHASHRPAGIDCGVRVMLRRPGGRNDCASRPPCSFTATCKK